MSALRVAVLLSGSGSNLQALIDARANGQLAAEIVFVGSDRADAYGLQRALEAQIPCAYVPLEATSDAHQRRIVRTNWETRLANVIAAFTPDLLVLAGFMRIVSATFLAHFPERVINLHPALLPDDNGPTFTTSSGIVIPALRGAHVVPEALTQRLPITGCTIHRVTRQVDAGPVLARSEIVIRPDDTEHSLHERIKSEERRLIVNVVNQLANLPNAATVRQ